MKKSSGSARFMRFMAAVCAFSLFGVLMWSGIPQALAVLPFPINDITTGTAGTVDPNWLYARSGTGNVGDTYTSDGWLRLTNAATNQATNILNATAFPASTGFQVSFDYRQAGGTKWNNTSTGDGIAMYLIDGNVPITNGIKAGGAGAGLGYANKGGGSASTGTCTTANVPSNQTGVTGGYLGLGLDVFGNFASGNFGNSGNATWMPSTAQSGVSEIGLRGSGSGCGPDPNNGNYPWVTGIQYPNLWTGKANNTTDPAQDPTSSYRRVSITVQPSGNNVQVTVAISALTVKSAAAGPMTQVFSANLNNVNGQVPLPANLRLGFSASTGLATDFHDIRNITVSALTDPSITKALSTTTPGHAGYPAGTFLPGDPISFTLTATNNGPTAIGDAPNGVARVYDNLSDLPIQNVSWTCDASGGATCANGSGGTGSVVSQDWTGPVGSSVTVTVSGTVIATPDTPGTFTNTALLPNNFTTNEQDPNSPMIAQKDGGAIDINPDNNIDTAQFTVVTPYFTQTKSADATTYVVGQPITYTVVVTNNGTSAGLASLSDMAPAGMTVSDVTCVGSGGTVCNGTHDGNNVTGTINAPIGGVATFTITGTVTGGTNVKNTVTITPTDPGCTEEICGGGDASTPDLPVVAPALTLTKTATLNGTPTTALVAGQTITYQFRVTNSGQTAINALTIDDGTFPGAGTLSTPSCPVTTLAVGASTTCTATYTVQQADVDHGTLTNTATAQGTAPGVTTPTVSNPSSATLTATANPVLTLAKTATVEGNPVSQLELGEVIDYTFKVTNTGNVTMSGIRVAEQSFDGSDSMTDITCPVASLAPTESEDCTASYTVTQPDVDRGDLTNTAYAYGTAPGAASETRSNLGRATVPLSQTPAVSLVKAGALATGITTPHLGDTVNYTFTVTNTGNVSLHSFDLTDDLSGLSDITYNWPATTGILAPGATMTASASYALTQADINAGFVDNTATVTALDPSGDQVNDTDSATVPLNRSPKLDLVKSGALASGATGQAGDTIDYTFTATNNGNVTLTNVSIADSLLGAAAIDYTWPAGETPGTLLPGESVTATASYTVTQPNVNAGVVHNDATASGTPPTGPAVTGTASKDVPLTTAPALSLEKTGTLEPGASGFAGDQVDFTFKITNTGNVTLTGVDIADSMSGLSSLTYVWPNTNGEPDGTLAPNEVATATATYTLTQPDINAGGIENTATASGTPPTGPAVTSSDTANVPVEANPLIGIVKYGQLHDASQPPKAGDTVDYTFTVTNNGNVTLSGVAISDALLGSAAGTDYQWAAGSTPDALIPGGTAVATATYTLTQADIDAGTLHNEATVTGTPPTGPDVTDSDSNDVTLTPAPAILLTKTGQLAVGPTGLYNQIDYSFTIKNTGNVTLTGVGVTDPLTGMSALTYTWPNTNGEPDGTLAPGETATATATYTMTQTDVDNGNVHNTATAAGTPPATAANPHPAPVTNDASADVPIAAAPVLALKKAANFDGAPVTALVADQTIQYTFEVTNAGNVTMTNIGVTEVSFNGTDPMSDVSCPTDPTAWTSGTVGKLGVGDAITCTASYTVTQEDVDAGTLINVATAQGTPPGTTDPISSMPATVHVPSDLVPDLTVTKVDDLSGIQTPARVGDPIDYTITAQNTGNVTLSDLAFTDSLQGVTVSCPTSASLWTSGVVGTLAPDEEITCTASYALTSADLTAGTVDNTATATAKDPQDHSVTGEGSVSSDLTPYLVPQFTQTKTADAATYVPGQAITYTITVGNSGSASGTADVTDAVPANVTVSDMSCTATPAGTATCDASHSGNNLAGSVGLPVGGQAVFTIHGTVVEGPDAANTAVVTPTTPGCDAATADCGGGDGPTPPLPVLNPQLTLAKTATVDGAATTALVVNDQVTYLFAVTNNGDTPLSDVSVTEGTFTGTGTLSAVSCPTDATAWTSGTVGLLNVGDAITCSASYTVTQEDVDAGTLSNTATAQGTPPGVDVPVVSPPDTAVMSNDPMPKLTVTKVADLSGLRMPAQAGQRIVYTITAQNTGDVTLSHLALTDSLPGVTVVCPTAPTDWTSNRVGVLAPDDTVTCTASYPLTTVDLANGLVANTATGNAQDPQGDPVTGTDTITSDLTPYLGPHFTQSKTADADSYVPGQAITYTITVGNDGSGSGTADIADAVPTNVTVADATCAATPTATAACTVDRTGNAVTGTVDLPVGGQAVFTVTGTVESGPNAKNTVVVTPTTPGCDAATADCGGGDGPTPPLPVLEPSVSLTKTATVDGATATTLVAGDQLTYLLKVTNTGETPLSDVGVTEGTFTGAGTLSAVSCPADAADWASGQVGVLAPNDSVTCTATYTVQQADVDAGTVTNTATAQGTPPGVDTPVDSDPATAHVSNNPLPELTVTKVADTSGLSLVARVGDRLAYTITAANTGNVTLHGLALTDSLPGVTVYCPSAAASWPSNQVGVLAPQQSVDCTASYSLTQADLDNGKVSNTAHGVATPPVTPSDPNPTPVTDDGTVVTDITPFTGAALVVGKTADLSGLHTPVTAGESVAYTITAQNTGDVTLTGLSFADSLPGVTVACPTSASAWTSHVVGTLAPTDTITCTASYPLTQTDLDNATVANTATGTAEDPHGNAVSDHDTVTSNLTPYVAPSLTVHKTADLANLHKMAQVGDPIDYTITAKNTGDVTLTDVTVTDSLAGLTGVTYTWPDGSTGTTGTLKPGQTVTVTASYALTAADLTAADVSNTAVGNAEDPKGQPVTDTSTVDSDLTPYLWPHFTQTKTADADSYVPGQAIAYTITVTNNGTARGTATVFDPVPSTVSVSTAACSPTPLGSAACTVGHTGNAVSGTVDLPVGGTAAFRITGTVISGPDATNTAVITPTTPGCEADNTCGGGNDPTPPLPVLTPALSLVKSGTVNGESATVLVAGQQITYQFTITNTGQTPLDGVHVLEGDFSGTGTMSSVVCPRDDAAWTSGTAGLLAPNDVVTCTATYTLTQNDVDAGVVWNNATAEGTPPGVVTPVFSPPASAQVPSDPDPSLSVVKTDNLSAVRTPAQVGDQIAYTIRVQNLGTVTLSNVSVTDALTGLSDVSYRWPDQSTGTTGQLKPGQAATVTAEYALTQADLDAGKVVNTAVATGTPPVTPADPDPQPIPPTSDTVTSDLTSHLVGALDVVKTADTSELPTPAQAGDPIAYTIKATNSGDVTLSGVTVTDALAGMTAVSYTWPDQSTGSTGTLAPGQTVTVTASYPLTQADLDAGKVVNTAIAAGKDPHGHSVTGKDTVTTDVTDKLSPALTVVKTADTSGLHTPPQLGDRIAYTIKATNSGDVTLSGVAVTDSLAGLSDLAYTWPDGSTGSLGVLAPGQAVTVTASYTVTQADLDAGKVLNTATVSGTPPTTDPANPPVPVDQPSNPVSTPLTQHPAISLSKTGALPTGDAAPVAGDTVTYTFTATNTGNVTLTGVTITDKLAGVSDIAYTWPGAAGVLLPGQQATATATYRLTQADVNSGDVHNVATATGSTPPGSCLDPNGCVPPSSTGSSDVVIPAKPALTMAKSANVATYSIGSVIAYTFTITNTGNVTLSNVTPVEGGFSGKGAMSSIVCPGTTLTPGQALVCTAKYTATQADVAAGTLTNTAVAAGTPPIGIGGTPGLTTSKPSTVTLTGAPVQVSTGGSIATGSDTTWPLGLAAFGLILIGGALIVTGKKREGSKARVNDL